MLLAVGSIFLLLSVGGIGGLFPVQVEPVGNDGHGEKRTAMFCIGIKCTASCRLQSRFVQATESGGKDNPGVMDTACRIDNDTNIDLARFMLLDGTCLLYTSRCV